MRHLVIIGAALACLAAWPAAAQAPHQLTPAEQAAAMQARLNAPPDPNLPPVDSLTCAQMQAELAAAGQRMHAQMDPSFAANVQAMQTSVQKQEKEAMAQAAGTTAACAVPVPGAGAACMAAQQAQTERAISQGQKNQAQMAAINSQVFASMQGIDMARMDAVEKRFESQHCPTQAPPGAPH
jgi:hypothetical protein